MPAPGTTLVASETTTVLTCEPLDFGTDNLIHIMNTTLSGFAPAHGTVVRVPTDSNLTWAGLRHARDILQTYIAKTPGRKIVFGYSRGAQVDSEWLRAYADRPQAPSSSDLTFVFIGNPQRRIGGSIGKTLDGVQLLPAPDTTQYTVTDISRRRDGWANADNWPDGLGSNGSSSVGTSAYLNTIGKFVVHSHYEDNAIDDPHNQVRAVAGHTTYIVGP